MLQVLRVILGREVWPQLNSTILKTLHLSSLSYGTPVLRRSDCLESSTGGTSKPKELEDLQLTKRENPSSRASFDKWVRRGNPFIDRKVGNIVSSTADENGKVKSGVGSYQQRHPQDVRAGDEEGEDEYLLADFIDEDSQMPGRLEIEHMQNSAKVSQSYESSLILTTSAVNLLRYMEKYIKLMQILQPIVSEVFRGLCQLFELYFTVFKVFGNRDFLSTPLRSALVRISQGLEEQRVQLPPSPKRTSSTGPPSSPGNSALSAEASSAGATMLPVVPSNLFALKERAAAVESLLCLTQILQNSHLDLTTMLPQDTLAYMEQFLNETPAKITVSPQVISCVRSETCDQRLLQALYQPCFTRRGLGPYFCEDDVPFMSEDDVPFICTTDLLGAKQMSKDFVVSGTASESLYGACESMYKPDL